MQRCPRHSATVAIAVLGTLSASAVTPEGLVNELRQAGYDGKVVCGQNLDTF